MTFLEEVRRKVEKEEKACATCGNLVRIGGTLIGCVAHDKLILPNYGWLDGDDSDNVLPATSFEEDADTVHIHDLAVFVTNQEAASVSVQVAPGSYVTREQMTTYAAPLVHTQGADTITETTGENTEQVQRRQDSDIEAIKEQLNTGFTGTTVTHTFAPAQLPYWKGYDGTGVPEGILDLTRNRLYL